MSRLFPSEVARLVLGYLKERGCHMAHDQFLHESPDLQEFRSCLSGPNTYDYPTSVNGKNLIQFLNNSQPATLVQAPVFAHAMPMITTSVPIVTAPVAAPAAAAAVSQRELELLRKVHANQATIVSLNRKMNAMATKVKSADGNQKSSGSQKQSNSSNRVTTATVTQPIVQSVPTIVETVQQSNDPFKTPVKQIVRRSHIQAGYTTPGREKSATQSPSKKSTPRKSATPRKLSDMSYSSGELSIVTDSSPSDMDKTLTPSKLNKDNIHIEAEKVVEKFILNPGMPELLAEEINKIWNSYNESGVENLVGGQMSVLASGATSPVGAKSAPDPQADGDTNAPVDKMVDSVVKELEQHSTINQFISDFAANECLMDLDSLFGSESSPFSSYDSTPVHSVDDGRDGNESGGDPGSLTTPKSTFREQAIAVSTSNIPSSAVKNLMQDLRTPEKKITSPFNSSPFAPSVSTRLTTGTRLNFTSSDNNAPVCIVIPDEGQVGSQMLQLMESQAPAKSPVRKFRRIEPSGPVPVQAQASAVGQQAKQKPVVIRVTGSGQQAKELKQAMRAVRQVPGKHLNHQNGNNNKQNKRRT